MWQQGNPTPNIEENIKSGRRIAYSLMRIGLHGKDGLGPAASMKVLKTYVIPELIHRLDALYVSEKGTLQVLKASISSGADK